jgi:hypothetical protein|tara:strand:- start:2781 stop:3203 length:423 start_codon:yes stop_codon:yes gene_type:complete
MKELLKYRDNCYFNATDYFLALDNLGQYHLTNLELYNGKWYPKFYKGFKGGELFKSGHWFSMNKVYSKGCAQINMTSMPAINCNELCGKEVEYVNTGIKGNLTNFSLHNMGVNWHQGQGKLHKKYGFPQFWNNPKNLEFL